MPDMRQRRHPQTNFHVRLKIIRRILLFQRVQRQQLRIQRQPLQLSGIDLSGRAPETKTMKLENVEMQEKLTQRLRRIEGQVRGIESMLESGRECREIIQQLAAVQNALHGFSRTLLEEYAVTCLLPPEDQPADRKTQERNLRELIELINKAP